MKRPDQVLGITECIEAAGSVNSPAGKNRHVGKLACMKNSGTLIPELVAQLEPCLYVDFTTLWQGVRLRRRWDEGYLPNELHEFMTHLVDKRVEIKEQKPVSHPLGRHRVPDGFTPQSSRCLS